MVPRVEPSPLGSLMKALIIGGGIGGLAAALALRRAGLDGVVFEQAPALRESGAGLTLWSNATRALDKFGLTKALHGVSTPIERGEIRDWTGRTLAGVSLGDLGRKLGGPILGVHRADLLGLLAEAVGPADVRLAARFVNFEQDEHGVTAVFADGPRERGDLLIGADGIHSQVRACLLGDPQRYAGYVGWRGADVFRHPAYPAGVSIWAFGRGGQFGLVPIGGGRTFWFATARMPEEEIARLGPHRDELRTRFGHWHTPVPELIEAIDPGATVRTPIYDRPPVNRWGTGAVTLLGDAAHATTPTLGHGACLAIESSVVLARELSRGRSLETALRSYERDRQKRTARIINESFRVGNLIHWRNPLACWLRDLVMRWTPRVVHRRTLERIVAPGCAPVEPAGETG
jgi:2-polyprenyl-6-methoxyphenol hydroxylase-like FAD-dependent oxidoreductase